MTAAAKRAEAGTSTLVQNRPGRRTDINPRSMEVTVVTDIMDDAPPTVARTSNREEADDYRGHLVLLNADWRLVQCSAGIQWILQRRRGATQRVRGRWASIGYHRSRETLKTALARHCGDVRPDAFATLDALPAWIEEACS